MRLFHIGDILSIVTGRLVSPRHMTGVYDILNHMTGDDLSTHQLPRAADECRPWLLRQHPDLEIVSTDGLTPETWEIWLADQVRHYGAMRSVEPLPADDYTRRDPLEELHDMVPDKPIIVIES